MNQDLRSEVTDLFNVGVRAADPGKAVDDALRSSPLSKPKGGRQIVIAIGKAAASMMKAALPHTGDDTLAIAVVNYENKTEIPGCTVYCAGHPVPDENGLKASRQILRVLMSANEYDSVLCLISGGASALVPAPILGLTLEDKAKTNELMLASGLEIEQMNLVRQQLSMFKGGGMRQLAAPAAVRTLIVSDVISDDPRAIASGPTASPLGSRADACRVLDDFGIFDRLPEAVQKVLREDTTKVTHSDDQPDLKVICSNSLSLEAIKMAGLRWSPQIVSAHLSGNVDDVAKELAEIAAKTPKDQDCLLIWGGETTVVVKGSGKGGRNQELALRFALEAEGIEGDWVFLSGGTDGRDGPTDAAGAIVDGNSARRLNANNSDLDAMLNNNDSNAALAASGDLLMTGATGTNVADLVLFLRRKA